MRLKRPTESEPTQLDMTSMLDVVFIMLIFFVLISSFSSTQNLDIQRAQTQAGSTDNKSTLRVSINKQGLIYFQEQAIELTRLKAAVGNQLSHPNNKSKVIIDADIAVKHGRVMQVIDQIKQAGAENIALASDALQ